MTEDDPKYAGAYTIEDALGRHADAQPGETYQQRVNAQMRKEIEEADQEWVRKQKLLDHLWQAKLDAESDSDDDIYEVGGFVEYHSKTPSYTKGRRDRDWKVR